MVNDKQNLWQSKGHIEMTQLNNDPLIYQFNWSEYSFFQVLSSNKCFIFLFESASVTPLIHPQSFFHRPHTHLPHYADFHFKLFQLNAIDLDTAIEALNKVQLNDLRCKVADRFQNRKKVYGSMKFVTHMQICLLDLVCRFRCKQSMRSKRFRFSVFLFIPCSSQLNAFVTPSVLCWFFFLIHWNRTCLMCLCVSKDLSGSSLYRKSVLNKKN